MERIIYKNILKYIYSVVSSFNRTKLNEYIDFYLGTSEFFNKTDSLFYNNYKNYLEDLKIILNFQNASTISITYSDNNRSRIFVNHILRNLNTFLEISDIDVYFDTYSKYSRNSLVHNFMSVFYHVSYRGRTFQFTIPIMRKLYNYCLENNLLFLASDIGVRISELYYSVHDFKRYSIYSSYFDSNIKNYKDLIKIKYFMEEISIRYESIVYVEESKLDDMFVIIFSYEQSGEINVLTRYYFYLLKIEYTYYRQPSELNQLLKDFYSFLNFNVDLLDKNIIEAGYLNYFIHSFLITPNIEYLKSMELLYNNCLRISSIKVAVLINIIQMALVLRNVIFIQKYILEIQNYCSSPAFKSYSNLISYYLATNHHLNSNYKDSQLALNEASPLLNDKSGFGLGIRILEIMNWIKWDKKDQVELALLNLKNQITFLRKGGTIKPRYLYIYKILVKLHSCGYDFKETFRLHEEKLCQMNGDLREYAWEFRGPELLRFDLWFFDEAGFLPPWNLHDPRLPKTPSIGVNSQDS